MTTSSKISHRLLISGGGTGGHIFPAIALAEEWKRMFPDAEILFVGAKGKMEMDLVPKYGFNIVGLPIRGVQGKGILSKLAFPFRLLVSVWKSFTIIKKFKPDIAIGTGGYASGVSLWVAALKGIPIFIQEQNAIPGLTNRWLSKRANAAFVAYPMMENYFKCSVYQTGNPLRFSFQNEAKKADEKFTILSIGGSLGARTLNEFWKEHISHLEQEQIHLIWQCGKGHKAAIEKDIKVSPQVELMDFISDMQSAYQQADLIISRAGALAISELALVAKPTIFVPFPYAVQDHQTHNAQELVRAKAALMVKDDEVKEKLWDEIIRLKGDKELQQSLSAELKKFAKPKATKEIIEIIIKEVYGD